MPPCSQEVELCAKSHWTSLDLSEGLRFYSVDNYSEARAGVTESELLGNVIVAEGGHAWRSAFRQQLAADIYAGLAGGESLRSILNGDNKLWPGKWSFAVEDERGDLSHCGAAKIEGYSCRSRFKARDIALSGALENRRAFK